MSKLYTILYYTSNREDPVFEEKIKANILANKGDIPIISISQKPIDFGENICVGEVGLSYLNEYRQIYLGAKRATTPYLIFTESDFLYPPDYFQFVPPDDNECYRSDNVWVVLNGRRYNSFRKKSFSEGAQIVGRELFIGLCEKYLEGLPEWFDGRMPLKGREPLFYHKWKWFSSGPCITFKTGHGVRNTTNTLDERTDTLPHWGHIGEVKKQYL